MTQYQKGIVVMDYLQGLKVDWGDIGLAICDENLETSYRLIKENSNITKTELFAKLKTENV